MLSNKCAVADFGNSRVKIYAGGKHEAFHYNEADSIIRFVAFAGVRILGYSSVNPTESDFIIKKINHDVIRVIGPNELISSQKRISFRNVAGMGADRAFGLIAASAKSASNFATVDCGTAVTVNIAKLCVAEGGGIFCGFYTQHRALKKFTAGIRNITPGFNATFPGGNTKDAVNTGILLSIAGGIKLMLEKYEQENNINLEKIYFTGGYSGEIAGLTGINGDRVEINENLVLEGVGIALSDYINKIQN